MPRPAIYRVLFRGVLTEGAQRALAADGLDFQTGRAAGPTAGGKPAPQGTAHSVHLVATGADDARERVQKALSGCGGSVAYEVELASAGSAP
jgi:hypothetical protein